MHEVKSVESIQSVNDFVIKFANVNGSGSASANQMFAKAMFRMGIPVSPKNIFPSNLQGIETNRRSQHQVRRDIVFSQKIF